MSLLIDKIEKESSPGLLLRMPEWTSDFGSKLVVVFSLLVAAHIAYVFFSWGGEENQSLISNLFSFVVYTGPFFLAFRTSRNNLLTARARRAWLVIALANLSYSIAG